MKQIFTISAFLIFLFNYGHLSCQVNMKMDPRIKKLIYKRASMNKVKIGYRIHLTFDGDIKKIQDDRVKVISRFPGLDTYVIFRTPSFYLEAGNFLTEHEAELVRKKMRSQFPMSSVVRQKIEMPRIK